MVAGRGREVGVVQGAPAGAPMDSDLSGLSVFMLTTGVVLGGAMSLRPKL
jgi:hypothetical protein